VRFDSNSDESPVFTHFDGDFNVIWSDPSDAESVGGLLSHSAICAREYAIPCVVATGVATARIRGGSTITMDGTKGIVTLHADEVERVAWRA